LPKGVWVDPYDPETAKRRSVDFRRFWNLRQGDVHLICSPLSHSAPHRYSLRTLEAGGTVAVQDRFDAAETLAAIELFGVTTTFMVPTHIERILGLGRTALARHDLSSVRALFHAGAPIRTTTKEQLLDLFPGGRVWEFYGSTEGHFTRISEDEWRRKPGSVGRPRDGARIVITDEEGSELEPGATGQVWVDDPASERFRYWDDDDKTRDAWLGSAFTAGDLGYVDEDGYLFLVGRRDDLIISGGVNVYPAEVEAVLSEHPAVAEAVVFGTPDAEMGQKVCAHVVLHPEAVYDEGGFEEWMRERLAGYKLPRSIVVVDELERTPTGKVRRPSSVEG
jgi:long-chain acyl-CoA synthetase